MFVDIHFVIEATFFLRKRKKYAIRTYVLKKYQNTSIRLFIEKFKKFVTLSVSF
jgi:hypothetical protein